MVVKIVPIKRLPPQLNELDYSVPKNLEKDITVGQMVTIPFRKSEIFGLILDLDKNKNDKKLKEVKKIIHHEPFLTTRQIKFLTQISKMYQTSLPTTLKMALLPLQKNKLNKIKLTTSFRHEPSSDPMTTNSKIKKPKFYCYQNKAEHKKYLLSSIKNNTLILAPEIHLIDEIRQLLPIEQQKQVVVWHSKLSDKQKFSRWVQIRNLEKTIIIGTRGAIFLPFLNLKSIIIDHEHLENHKHWDQAPRFHDKDVARLLASYHGAQISYMSFSPSSISYFHVHKKNYNLDSKKLINNNYKNLKIINIGKERQAGNFDIFSFVTEEQIEKTEGDIFLLVNKLGFAGSLNCEKCGHIEKCQNCKLPLVYFEKNKNLCCNYCHSKKNIPTSCPKCQSPLTKLKGRAIEYVEKKVEDLIKKKSNYKIIRIDSTIKDKRLYTKKNKIVIGTQMALKYINWQKTNLIAILDIDRLIQIPEYMASEKVWHLINEINYYKKTSANFFIQTNNPENLIFRSLQEPDRFYRTDLNQRQKLGYPPYSYLIKYFYGNPDFKTTKIGANKIYDIIAKELTKIQKSAKISGPIEMYPRYYRKKFWFAILVKLDAKNWPSSLIKINKLIPQGWKIDPNPISILSP